MQNKFIGFAALSILLLAGCATVQKPAYDTLIAHRGESKDAPENTLPAYQMAVDRGFGFECDLYLSSDKRVFSFHDRNLKRTTGVDMPCNQASWAETVSKIDAGAWKGAQFKGVRPALLEEILPLARNGRRIYIEIKSGPEIIPYIKDIFARQSNATPDNALFICFSQKVCAELKKQMPKYKVYWLTGWGKPEKIVTAEEVINVLKAINADGVDICFNAKVHDAEFVRKVRSAGFEFHVWTVDHLETTLQAFAVGAQTVTTNCAKKQLDEYNNKQ